MAKDELTYSSLITQALTKSSPIGIESTTPSILEDGNTIGWYDYLENITKDGSDFVSVFGDKSGNGNDLLQAVGTNQPKWFLGDGILFDGIDNVMKAVAFTYNQPEQIYIVFKQVTWTASSFIFDGNANGLGALRQQTSSSNLITSAPIASPLNSGLALDTFGIVRVLFNGVNSSFQINNSAEWEGNSGANNMGGFTIGAYGGANFFWSNIQIKEIILREIEDTAPNKQIIYDYLSGKYSI